MSDNDVSMGPGLEDRVEAVLRRLLAPLVEQVRKRLEMPPQEWFSIKQAAAYAGLSGDHVRRAVTGAMLPCSNVGTPDRPLYRISRRDLEGWLEKRKAGALPPPRRKKGRAQITSLPPSRHFAPRVATAA